MPQPAVRHVALRRGIRESAGAEYTKINVAANRTTSLATGSPGRRKRKSGLPATAAGGYSAGLLLDLFL